MPFAMRTVDDPEAVRDSKLHVFDVDQPIALYTFDFPLGGSSLRISFGSGCSAGVRLRWLQSDLFVPCGGRLYSNLRNVSLDVL
jgi:hypothetical protein